MSDPSLTQSTIVPPPEEFDTLQLLKTGVYKDDVGRAWVEVVETLSTRTIAVLCAELRRSPHTQQGNGRSGSARGGDRGP